MNLIFKLFVFTSLIVFYPSKNISNISSSFVNTKVIGEGTVTYVIPAFTPEISNHIGYILKDPLWKIPPTEERLRTFLEPDSIVKKYVNQYVHIEGLQYKMPGKKLDDHTYINPYDVIVVDKIYTIN